MDITSKQMAFDLFNTYRSGFLANAREIARSVAKKNGGFVNVDDVREQVTIPDGVSHSIMGSVFKCDEFEFSSYTITKRKTSHGRPISVWYWKGYVDWKSKNRQAYETNNYSLFA